MERFTRIIQILTGISIIVGIVAAITQVDLAVKGLKQSRLAQVNQLLDVDSDIRAKIPVFLNTYTAAKLDAVLKDHPTGELAYLSDELEGLRTIGRHYERMGALVKFDYIDFVLIFEVIPFPESFWEGTTSFRTKIRKSNWLGGEKGLEDFWANFEYLGCRYAEEREGAGNAAGASRLRDILACE